MKTFNFIVTVIFFIGAIVLFCGITWIYDLPFNHQELMDQNAGKAFITCILGFLIMIIGAFRRTR